jgi:hypothetical protein
MTRRFCIIVALLLAVVPVVLADQPLWAFEGQLPLIFQVNTTLPESAYSADGAVLSPEQIGSAMDIRLGDPVVLIRAGEVVGRGTIGEVVAQKRDDAKDRRVLFFRAAGLPEGVDVPAAPPGLEVLDDAGYDLYVLTDKPVEVLAPDPAFQDVPWGVHDYCVRVGRLRFAIIREHWRATGGFRGWQVQKLIPDERSLKIHADYTWQPR